MDVPAIRLPASPGSALKPVGSRDRARDDVVDHLGRPALAISETTPAQAIIDDLLFVRRILDNARIPFILIRNRGRRPVLAVDHTHAARLQDALTAGCAGQPFFVKARTGTRSGPARRLSGDWLSPSTAVRIYRVFRRRVDPRSGLSYGASTALQIELWNFGGKYVDLPAPNILTRTRIPLGQLVPSTTERFGETWPTIEGMFAPEVSGIGFPIDMVFSWVGESSSALQAARSERMDGYSVADDDRSPVRYRHIDELKYALRSVHVYAPWIRRIFIATDSERPSWLADDPRVTLVPSRDFFRNLDALPTHNSHAVESQLHHIPALAENFIYSNDDMFFGRPVRPSMFFSSGLVSKFIESDLRIGLGETDEAQSGFENAARVNRQLLLERFGVIITRHLAHAPTPLRRSVLERLEQEFPLEFMATAASPFRSRTDISVTNSLYHYYALLTGSAVVQNRAKVTYLNTNLGDDLDAMDELLKKRSQHFICLNDGGDGEVDPEERTRRITDFLERYFPLPAPWEVETPAIAMIPGS